MEDVAGSDVPPWRLSTGVTADRPGVTATSRNMFNGIRVCLSTGVTANSPKVGVKDVAQLEE